MFKLFKFNFETDVLTANQFLKQYGLFSFQHRIFMRFSTFSWRLFVLEDAPTELCYQLKLDNLGLNNFAPINSSKEGICQPLPQVLSLRSREVPKVIVSNTKYGELTFAKFFRKFVFECIKSSVMAADYRSFTNFISINIDFLYERFISIFLRFNLVIKNFDYKLIK